MRNNIHTDIIKRYFCWETEAGIASLSGLTINQIQKDIAEFCGLKKVYPKTRSFRSASEFSEQTGVSFLSFIKCLNVKKDDSNKSLENGLKFFSITLRSEPINTNTVREILRKSVDFNLIDETNAADFLDLAFKTEELRLGIYFSRYFCLEKQLLLFASALINEMVFFEIYVENFPLASEFSLLVDFYPSSREYHLSKLGGPYAEAPQSKAELLEDPTSRNSNEIFICYPDGITSETKLSNRQKREVLEDPFPVAKFVQILYELEMADPENNKSILQVLHDELETSCPVNYKSILEFFRGLDEMPNKINQALLEEISTSGSLISPTETLEKLRAKIAECKEKYLQERLRKASYAGQVFFYFVPIAHWKKDTLTLLDRDYQTQEIPSDQFRKLKFIDFPTETLAKNYLWILEHFGLSTHTTHNAIRPFGANLKKVSDSETLNWKEINEEVNVLGVRLLRDEGREYDRDSLLTMLGYPKSGDDEIPY